MTTIKCKGKFSENGCFGGNVFPPGQTVSGIISLPPSPGQAGEAGARLGRPQCRLTRCELREPEGHLQGGLLQDVLGERAEDVSGRRRGPRGPREAAPVEFDARRGWGV